MSSESLLQQVLTIDGNKNIANIVVGDILLGADNKQNTVKSIEILKKEKEQFLNINNGDFIIYENQVVFTNDSFHHACEIKVGDKLKTNTGEFIIVKSIKKTEKEISFYKLSVSNDHTYYINNILVHNPTVYWFGGTGNWNDPTNHWSNNSGNSPASLHGSAPGTDDDVVFDANSGTGTCTINATANCKSFDVSASSVNTIAGSSDFNVYGDFTLKSGMSFTYAGTLTFLQASGTQLITTAANTLTSYNVTFNSVGTTFRLVGNLTLGEYTTLGLTAGTFDGATNTAAVIFNANGNTIVGAFTFYDLTINTKGASTTYYCNINSNIVVTHALTIAGNSSVNRLTLKSNTFGTARSITTTGATKTITNVDIQDITAVDTGGAWDLSATASGDMGGNTNIMFVTGDTWYYHAAAAGTDAFNTVGKWFTATNGGGSVATYPPLPQDVAMFDVNSFDSAGKSVNVNSINTGSIIFSGVTNNPTLSVYNGVNVFGSITLEAGMTLDAGNAEWFFMGRGNSQTIDSAGKTWTKPIKIKNIGGSVTLKSNLVISSAYYLYLINGTFSAVDGGNNYNVTAGYVNISGSGVRALTMGSGTWEMTIGTDGSWFAGISTNLTFNAGTSTIKLTGTLTADRTFAGGGLTYNNIWNATSGAYSVIISGSNTFADWKINAGRLNKVTDGTDQTVTSLTWVGTQDNPVTITGTSTAGWKVSDTTGTNACDWLVLNYSTAEGGATFNANNTTGANNTGWNVTIPTYTRTTTATAKANIQIARFWVGGTGTWDTTDTTHWSLTSGGAGGASVPSTTQNVVFDAGSASDNYTVTINANVDCRDISVDKPTGVGKKITLTNNSSRTISIYGKLDFLAGTAGMNASFAGSFNFTFRATSGTKTIKTYGVALGCLTINGSGGTFQLLDTLNLDSSDTSSNQHALYAGTFDPNGQTVVMGFTNHTNTYVTTAWNFYNLTITGGSTTTCGYTIYGTLTIANTLTINGNSAINRLLVMSDTYGTARTFNAAAVSVSNVDFKDITGAGAATWDMSAAVGGSGNCGGNTMKSLGAAAFTAAATWYWHNGTGNVSDYTKWYTATNGGGSQMASTKVPLPQDTLRFDASSFDAGSLTITQNMPRIGSIDFTGATNTPAFTTSTEASVFGSITLITGMTLTASTQEYKIEGRGSYTWDSGGKTWEKTFTFRPTTGTYTLKSNLTLGVTRTLSISSGTLTCVDGANNWVISTGLLSVSSSATATLTLGSAIHLITGTTGTVWSFGVNGVLSANTSTIKLTGALTGAITFAGGGKTEYNNFWNATTNSQDTIITGSNTFNNFKLEPGRQMHFTDGTDQTITSLTALGTDSSSGAITMHGTSTAGWKLSCATGTISASWLYVTYCTAEGGATWNTYGGAITNSTGWNLLAGGLYWVGGTGNWNDYTNHWSTTSGGVGGAANIPISTKDVYFNSSSSTANAAYTVTINVNTAVKSFTMDGPGGGNKVTWAGSSDLEMHHSLTLTGGTAGITRTFSGDMYFYTSVTGKTVTLNSVALGSRVNFYNGTVTLQDAFYTSGAIDLGVGTLNTNNQAVTTESTFINSNSNTRTLTLGSSVITCARWYTLDPTGLTFNYNTSTIIVTGTNGFDGGSKTYYNVQLTGSSCPITGSNTFNSLSLDSTKTQTITFTDGTDQTVTTATLSGSVGKIHTLKGSSTGGWKISDTTGTNTVTYCNIQYSTAEGGATFNAKDFSNINGGNNSGWLFWETTTKIVTAKANIIPNWTTRTQTETSKARIQIIDVTKTLTAKGRIQLISSKIITALADIFKTSSSVISAKSSIFKNQDQTITSLARIQLISEVSITAKSRIEILSANTISAKGDIKLFDNTQTITAKASISIQGNTRSLTSKSRINVSGNDKTITSKGRILTNIDYSSGDYVTLPAGSSNLSTLFNSPEYSAVATLDDVYANQVAPVASYSVFQFRNQYVNSVDRPHTECYVKSDLAPSISAVYLQVYNITLTTWETLASNNIANADTRFFLEGTIDGNLDDYLDVNLWYSFRVYQLIV